MKLVLGTVQLGMDYGIANKSGLPSKEEALNILRKAYENGILMFDTAAAYGVSEERLGEFISEYNLNGNVEISSKVKVTPGIMEKNLHRQVADNLRGSLERLQVDIIDYYLLNNADDMYKYGRKIIDALNAQKEAGLIKKIGVSVYGSEDIRECIKYDEIEVLQLPFNVLDNRLIENGLLKEAWSRGIEIHARSVYLQGLLMLTDNIPENLAKAMGYISWLSHVASEELDMSLKELAFLYVRDNKYISKMLLGCESVEQLIENIEFNKKPALSEEIILYLQKTFKGIPEDVLNPILWKSL